MRKSMCCAVWVLMFFLTAECCAFTGSDQEQRDLALMRAAHNGTAQEVRDALAAGGNPNAAHFGPGGMTPLMFAAANNTDAGVIAALLKAGAKVEVRTAAGETALIFAARYNRPLAIMTALLAPKEAVPALLNAQDWNGNTALLLSTRNNARLVAEALLLDGADGTIKNDDGHSAFWYASIFFRESPIFVEASPEVTETKIPEETRRKIKRLAAGGRARGEPESASEEREPQYVGDAKKYADEPGLLSAKVQELEPIRENAGIDLNRYDLYNPKAVLPTLGEPVHFSLFARAEMPVLDGALASFPLYSAFARVCYAGLDPPSDEEWKRIRSFVYRAGPVKYSNTIPGFRDLIDKKIDIFFGLTPDAEQKAEAASRGRELAYTPLGREAFVFFTHRDNPINSLTQAQIKDIYAGRITNWKELGGLDQPILAFQRNKGSGSQSALERFMGDTPLAKPPMELEPTMEGIVLEVARYRPVANALGYTFYFFATRLAANDNVKLLAVDGVAPSPEHIRDRSYPLLETRWAITLKENRKLAVARFLEWMQGPQGQKIVHDMGYVGNE